MPEYVTNTLYKFAQLDPAEKMEIAFDPSGAGVIKMTSSSIGSSLFSLATPSRGKMELLKPGGAVVAEKTEVPPRSILTYSMSAAGEAGGGMWTLRVTNVDSRAAKFAATVGYPTGIVAKTLSVPLAQINPVLAGLLALAQIKLHLESGENDSDKRSYLDIQHPSLRQGLVQAGLALPFHFHVPKVVYDPWWWPKITARLKDVNTASVALSIENASGVFVNGSLRLNVRFEEQGTEIVVDNAPDVNLMNMNLTVDLGLATSNGVLSYGAVDARFPVKADINYVPDDFLSVFINIEKLIRNAVESQIEGFLNNATLRQQTAAQIKKALGQLSSSLGANVKIHSARAAGENLTITYSGT
jgi:hypothetical protein